MDSALMFLGGIESLWVQLFNNNQQNMLELGGTP